MSAFEFVYIFEDGTVQVHPEAPSEVDLDCIENGTLQVLQCKHVTSVDREGLEELTQCHKSDADDEGNWWHAPA